MSAPAAPAPAMTPPEQQAQQRRQSQSHAQGQQQEPQLRPQQQQQPRVPPPQVANREAYEYWGYLFKADKTGTDRLKALLCGLKEVMHAEDPFETRDLTPVQLAHFYRSLHGNYDQLFLRTPSESIAFIYKSLGCLHSLQPLAHSGAFTEPTVPALKTDGWILWQTIQLLLGPDEHSGFLIEAVQKWDVKDPTTGEVFPKLLPRECFPREPDKHMVAWHEGVSERLRREAEQQEQQREVEAEQAAIRRLKNKAHRISEPRTEQQLQQQQLMDDEDSLDSRGPALAYFRNPLYRHVDGRPSIVRRESKRPGLSPRPTTMMGKGKEAASTFTHVVKNIGSPNLWSGRATSADARDRDRRRRSLPDHKHHHPGDVLVATSNHGEANRHSGSPTDRRPRSQPHRSSQLSASADNDEWNEWDDDDPGSPVYSPGPSSGPQQHPQPPPPQHQRLKRDSGLRHSRSHEPTPSQREIPDYFSAQPAPEQAVDENAVTSPLLPNIDTTTSNTSAAASTTGSNGGGGFGPSASPLFAARVARQPAQHAYPPLPPAALQHPPAPSPSSQQSHYRHRSDGQDSSRPHYSSADPYVSEQPAMAGAAGKRGSLRPQDNRPYSQSPAGADRMPRREASQPRRARFEGSTEMAMRREGDANYDGERGGRESRSRGDGDHYGRDRDWDRDRDRDRDQNSRRGSSRRSGSEGGALHPSASQENGRRSAGSGGLPPHSSSQADSSSNLSTRDARYRSQDARGGELRAVSGVDGRRYVDGMPWR